MEYHFLSSEHLHTLDDIALLYDEEFSKKIKMKE